MTPDIAAVLAGERQWCVIDGDARDVLAELPDRSVHHVITDPPWPGQDLNDGRWRQAAADVRGVDASSAGLWDSVAPLLPRILSGRLVVHVGPFTDPRLICGSVPASLPFRCLRMLRYVPPGYHGTMMREYDVAYVFGASSRPHGATVVPAVATATESSQAQVTRGHPTPRNLAHLLWLVRWFTDPGDLVCDPFCGSGTTGVACIRLGRRFIGIDLSPEWAALSRERLDAESRGLTLADSRAGQEGLFA